MSPILATLAFLILLEGIILAFFNKSLKKSLKELAKKRNADSIIRKIGLWEILIGLILMIAAVLVRNW